MSDQGASKSGQLATLLSQAVAGVARRSLDGEQLTLFEACDPLPDDDRPAEGAEGARRGRPPGAQNKATEEFRRFVRTAYGDPLLKLFERIFADPVALSRALNAEAWDVFKAQSEWMLRVLPYMHSQMPAELKVSGKGALAVAVGAIPGLPTGDRELEGGPLEALLRFAKENQALIGSLADHGNVDGGNAKEESVTEPMG